jgi:hypothetical protein
VVRLGKRVKRGKGGEEEGKRKENREEKPYDEE